MKKAFGIFAKSLMVVLTIVAICSVDAYAAKKKSSKKSSSTPKQETIIVDNKTSKFSETLSDISAKGSDTSADELAERVRKQREKLDQTGNKTAAKAANTSGANKCDTGLRKCMSEKCGSDFTKCAGDSTAIWGEKMDSCRRKTECSGHEYNLLAPEILADRDMNQRMAYYDSVISCGNEYNSCIFTECGKTLNKCLSKKDGDRAISKCESIARKCKEQDSGLGSRVMTVFGDMRKVATAQAEKDEKRLYELRDLMRKQCTRFGAMFDERTFDCVYTVNFFAGDDASTPKASKKLYAGDSFQCNANWFGIDVTTFKENAYRRTRAQTAASSAMLGAGVGVAAGLISSGALNRALDTQKAKKEAKQECEDAGFTWEKGKCNQDKPNNKKTSGEGEGEGTSGQGASGGSSDGQSGGGEGSGDGQGAGGEGGEGESELTPEQQIQQNAQCLVYETQDECNNHSDTCEWTEEDGIGECGRKRSAAQTQSTTPETDGQNPEQQTDTQPTEVSINLVVTDKDNTVQVPAEISCQYVNDRGRTKTERSSSDDNMHIVLNVKPDADCTITSSYCQRRTGVKASQLATLSNAPMQCEAAQIERCLNRNKCKRVGNQVNSRSGNDGIEYYDMGIELIIDTPHNLSGNSLFLTALNCDKMSQRTVIQGASQTGTDGAYYLTRDNKIRINFPAKEATCTISSPNCDTYTVTAQQLKSMKDRNDTHIRLVCPKITNCLTNAGSEWLNGQCLGANVTLTWAEVSNKYRINHQPWHITSLKCGSDTVLSADNPSITVARDTECKAHDSFNAVTESTARKASNIKTSGNNLNINYSRDICSDNVPLTWNDVKNEFKLNNTPTGITQLECGDKNLSATASGPITVPYTSTCKVYFVGDRVTATFNACRIYHKRNLNVGISN